MSFIIVCEAGCRPSSDKIVYEVSKIAAASAEIAKRRLETTSAPATDGSENVATAENSVVCVAGCYDDPKSDRNSAKAAVKKADAAPAEPQSGAVNGSTIVRHRSKRP